MAIAPRLIRSPATQQFLLGQSLSQQAANQAGQPVYATSQGLARIAQALGGALLQNRAQKMFQAEEAEKRKRTAAMLQGVVPEELIPLFSDPDQNTAAIATAALADRRAAARERDRDARAAATTMELQNLRNAGARDRALLEITANKELNNANIASKENIAQLNRDATAAQQQARLEQEQGNFEESNRLQKEAAKLAQEHDEKLARLRAELASVTTVNVVGTGDNGVPVGATAKKTTDAQGNVTFDNPVYPPSSAEERVISILNEYERLAINDPDILNQPEYKNYKAMFDKYTRAQCQPGMSLIICKDGSVSLQTGDQNVGAGLPATRAVVEVKGLNQRATIIEDLSQMISYARDNPSDFGAVGGLQNFVQQVGGVLQDLDPTNFTAQLKDRVAGLYPDDVQARKDFDPFFNPELPKSEIAINAIAFQLAADRIVARGDSVRSLAKEFEIARKSLSLRGLSGSQDVLARLEAALEELQSTQRNVQKALGQSTQTPEQGDNPTVRTVPFEGD